MVNLKEEIVKEAQRIHEDSEITYKAHFVASEKWDKCHFWLGIVSIILSTTAGSLALSRVFPNFEIISGLCGFSAAAVVGVNTFLRPERRSINHMEYANKYKILRDNLRVFYNIETISNKDEMELKQKLTKFITQKCELDVRAPLLSIKDYSEVKKRISRGETEYKTNKENIK
jgi:hypothetical protein